MVDVAVVREKYWALKDALDERARRQASERLPTVQGPEAGAGHNVRELPVPQ